MSVHVLTHEWVGVLTCLHASQALVTTCIYCKSLYRKVQMTEDIWLVSSPNDASNLRIFQNLTQNNEFLKSEVKASSQLCCLKTNTHFLTSEAK